MKLLLLEDSLSDIDACVTTAETYKDEKKRDLEILVAKNIDEARHELYINDCDGAIIDLRIEANPLAGKQIVDFISSLNLRMPIVIFTGTPDEASSIACCIGKFNKGEITYAKIFDLFFDVAQTGLIKIMGRKGIIENCLNSVYRQDIIPAIGRWTELAGKFSGDEIERALCRHTLSHLLFMLSGNSELYFPEECYLHIDAQKGFPKSGEIIKNSENVFFAILTPPCDLEVRHDRDGDHVNVDRIQIVQFLPESELKNKIMHTSSPTRRQCEHWDKICHNDDVTFGVFAKEVPMEEGEIEAGEEVASTIPTLSTDIVWLETIPSAFGQIKTVDGLPDKTVWELYTEEMLALLAQ